ncbi:isocitrate/isopropylmalate family dehydrogenase [Lentzea flava]|uniref:isocitrate/isopropylmalate family dehydrogenase n=1 Tax=Lentzea flava TaxID=103732 RepID=UPI00166FC8B7|nr:isocitrate/isopropylmalate family dehydrogenase [Lentzea flava]
MDSITVIPGDGIGPEVVGSALEVLGSLGTGLEIDVLDHAVSVPAPSAFLRHQRRSGGTTAQRQAARRLDSPYRNSQ